MHNLLLLDADVVIDLHRLGFWEKLVKSNKVYLAGTVIKEVTHFWDKEGNKIPIDLSPQIANGQIIEIEGTPEKQAELLEKLKEHKLDGLDAGELESITVIYYDETPGLKFCAKERFAIKVLSFLDLSEKAISVEQALRDSKLLTKKQKLHSVFSRKRFEQILCEGKFIQIEKTSLKSGSN